MKRKKETGQGTVTETRDREKEDHKKPMQGYAYIIEVLAFWRYNPIS